MRAVSFVPYENASVRGAKAVFIPDSVGEGSGASLMRLQATLSQPIPDAGSLVTTPRAKASGFPVSHIPQVAIYFSIISTDSDFKYLKNIIFILWWHNPPNFNSGCFTCLFKKYVF